MNKLKKTKLFIIYIFLFFIIFNCKENSIDKKPHLKKYLNLESKEEAFEKAKSFGLKYIEHYKQNRTQINEELKEKEEAKRVFMNFEERQNINTNGKIRNYAWELAMFFAEVIESFKLGNEKYVNKKNLEYLKNKLLSYLIKDNDLNYNFEFLNPQLEEHLYIIGFAFDKLEEKIEPLSTLCVKYLNIIYDFIEGKSKTVSNFNLEKTVEDLHFNKSYDIDIN